MKVGVGYSDNPETAAAGIQAVTRAVKQAGRDDPCDMVLLFSTARHDQQVLRSAVASVAGYSVPVYGGGAVGVITNEYFGYAGDQIAVACIWLDGVRCEAITEAGLEKSEEETGVRLGQRLAGLGTKPETPVMMFYDALDCSNGVRMLTATGLLAGIEKGLGFFPDLTGAGLMGDHSCSPSKQWTGDTISEYNAIALAFSGDIRIDSVIMHGCRPSTQYYTVTKADGQVILEINGKQAIQFIDELLGPAVTPEQYPFFLILGVNHGDRWGEYNEDYYASRLCLGLDRERGGIVMFEPDMVEGTEFQLMFQNLEPDYIKPKIDKVFNELDGREPVFAVYIDCAGRCAGYGGDDIEDAPVIQQTVAGRVPVLGLYTGVEIASIGGRPRGLDWTGVFCLFSQGKDGETRSVKKAEPAWDSGTAQPQSKEIPVEAMTRLNEQNAAKITALTAGSMAIRRELEKKRRGFSLLAELAVSLRRSAGYESDFIPAAKRINSALNMQRTVVLQKDDKELFYSVVLQGYSVNEKAALAGRHIQLPPELLDPYNPAVVTGADTADRLKEIRELFGLPYFISTPVMLSNEVFAVLITGRTVETSPFFLRLNESDVETVQAVCALLASVISDRRLAAADERNRIMVETMPTCFILWDEEGNLTNCNQETLSLFRLSNKESFLKSFLTLSPEYQPNGRRSAELIPEIIENAFVSGNIKYRWMHITAEGEPFPAEITISRIPRGEGYILAGYIRNLRDQEAVEIYTRAKNEFLASISHEIRTPLNAIQSMAQIAGEIGDLDETRKNLIDQGTRSVKLLTSAIEAILDFSMLDSGRLPLETGKFSVRELVEGICNITRKEAEEKSLYLTASVATDVPELLLGDSARLQQTLFNIVINAVKFTESGGVSIRVFREKYDKDGKVQLVFKVRDTGIGISEEQMTRLYKPLTTGDSAYSRKHGGMGMGLAVSSSLAVLMGGKITCDSRLGEGSIFTIRLPLSVPEEKTAKEDTHTPGREALRGMRILVAEDNKVNQMIISALLSAVGIVVTITNNGIEALDKLKKVTFDLILMDIQMPEMDGITATSQIRSDKKYADLPIVALTANAGPEYKAECMKAGMNDYLTKPIDVEKLYSTLIKWRKS